MAANVSVELNGQYSMCRGGFEISNIWCCCGDLLYGAGLRLLAVSLFFTQVTGMWSR